MRRLAPLMLFVLLLAPLAGSTQQLGPEALQQALRDGGLVLVMRHASSPSRSPDERTANPDNPGRERQLDELGRTTATDMGQALRRLEIPIAQVRSSPTYRTLETARYLGFAEAVPAEFLASQGMQAASELLGARLRQAVGESVSGGNLLLITHSTNVAAAFPMLEPTISQGEVLVFRPRGDRALLLGRVKIEEWLDW